MIKKLLCSFVALSISGSMYAQQIDTLLYESFDVDNTANYLAINSGNDQTWVNLDADGIADFNGRPQEWFWAPGGFADVDSSDGCLYSSSWLENFAPGNRNWLMTPPITVTNANFSLSWKSAPRQTPLYIDGYSVLISTTDNIETSFTDVAFQAGQYLTGAGNAYSGYTFSPGFVHGEDGTYIQIDPAALDRNIGVQRPFTVSLAQYVGQTIYIAFLHDADDDNLISLDDILVSSTSTGISEIAPEVGLSVFPNPASDKIELSYLLEKTGQVYAEIFDVKGAKVMDISRGFQIAGNQKLAINVSSLESGLYNVVLNASGKSISAKFLKQ
ncbi:MAG: choice-of-anchor J domain-containing protein [Bacteroidota bacterium]|jgi:hypothetical protein